jgi:hypothetical protein
MNAQEQRDEYLENSNFFRGCLLAFTVSLTFWLPLIWWAWWLAN